MVFVAADPAVRSPQSAIRLLIVAAYPIARAGLAALLGGFADIVVVGQSAGGADWAATVEATAPDVILLPLIGFDRALNRLGQGAGYYDRACAALPDARRIGLAWNVQEWPALPADPWDVPLDAVATQREWIGRS